MNTGRRLSVTGVFVALILSLFGVVPADGQGSGTLPYDHFPTAAALEALRNWQAAPVEERQMPKESAESEIPPKYWPDAPNPHYS